jgi:hypothetical protein
VDVRAAFVAQRRAAEAMQPGQGAFDNPEEDAEAAAMRTAGLGGPWTLPAPWTPGTRAPPSLLVMTLRTDKDAALAHKRNAQISSKVHLLFTQ